MVKCTRILLPYLSHGFACGSGERGLNRVFTCGGYKCPALLHKWPHKQPVARLGLEQYSVQMGIISPQLTIRPPPAKLWPSSITQRVSLICLLGQVGCACQTDKDMIFPPNFRFHSGSQLNGRVSRQFFEGEGAWVGSRVLLLSALQRICILLLLLILDPGKEAF